MWEMHGSIHWLRRYRYDEPVREVPAFVDWRARQESNL